MKTAQYESMNHRSTVYKISNWHEADYAKSLAKSLLKNWGNIDMAINREGFPIYLSFCDEVIGWTNLSDRCLTYKKFTDLMEYSK